MTEIPIMWGVAVLIGAGFGALYLALLWVGARALAGPRPALAFVGAAVARLALVLCAFFAWQMVSGQAGTLFAGLAGFVAIRLASTRAVDLRRKENRSWK